MKKIVKTLNIKDYQVNCYYSYSGYNTIEHARIITPEGYCCIEGTSSWCGRPWQRYDFQKAIYNGFKALKDGYIKAVIAEYKQDKNIKRLSAKKYNKFLAPYLEDDPIIAHYDEILNNL